MLVIRESSQWSCSHFRAPIKLCSDFLIRVHLPSMALPSVHAATLSFARGRSQQCAHVRSCHACVQALADLLKATHRGYFIPPRPEKNTVEGQRASSDFLESRRLALERYLQQLATHPVISRSQVGTAVHVLPAMRHVCISLDAQSPACHLRKCQASPSQRLCNCLGAEPLLMGSTCCKVQDDAVSMAVAYPYGFCIRAPSLSCGFCR